MSAESLTSLITGGLGAVGVLAIFLGLILGGKLHTDAEMKRADETISRQALALDKTEDALAEMRRAYADATARGDAAVRISEVIAGALSTAGGRRARNAP